MAPREAPARLTAPPFHPVDGGVRIDVHVQPRASRTECTGLHGGALKIRLKAPPVDGAANDELVRFLAERLKVPKSRISITSGLSSRRKVVVVQGISPAHALPLLSDS